MVLKSKKFFDIHVHINPDLFIRRYSIQSLGKELRNSESFAVLKSHTNSTIEIANIAKHEGYPIYGSIVLNAHNGGINPNIVKTAISVNSNNKMIIFMPTLLKDRIKNKNTNYSNSILSNVEYEDSFLNSTVRMRDIKEIISIASYYKIPIATGHLNKREIEFIYNETIKQKGILILTHPFHSMIGYNVNEIKEMLKSSDIYVELTILMYILKQQSADEVVHIINELDNDRLIISSDLGQKLQSTVTDGFNYYCSMLQEKNIGEQVIQKLIFKNADNLFK